IVGLVVFLAGIVVEFFSDRQSISGISTSIIIALSGLCLATLMFLFWFGLVGYLLARQTRALGSGYGDAYRLIEEFKFKDAIPLLERSIREGKETSDVLML